jgi:U3 small nucleolar RNA-associated protein 14
MKQKKKISELPHQYKSVSDFEQKIAQPIGRTWNPDFKFRKLIMPKVKTKLGAIITPIDKTDLANSIKRKS